MNSLDINKLEIGYISKPHGIKGEVFLRLHSDTPTWSEEPKEFEIQTRQARSFKSSWESMRAHKNGLIVKFEECAGRNEAESLIGSKVYLEKKHFESKSEDSPYYHELLGLEVLDKDEKPLGIIKDMLFTGHQDVLNIETESGDKFMAPYVDAFVLKTDFENKKIYLDLPEGLIDLK